MEYWMASNQTGQNARAEALEEVLQDPGSAVLFVGYPRWLLHFAAGCCLLFMLVGIPGNLITIVTLFRTKKLRNATAIFIMNLSISDLMFCCFNLPLATSTFWHSSWRHGALLCRLFPLMRYGLVAVSLFTILAITINRYVMIGHHRFYPSLYKPKYLTPMVLSTWIVAFGVLIVTWLEIWGRFGLDIAIGSCSILPDIHGRSPKEFLFVVAFLIPCVAIVVCYARIFYIVRKAAFKSRRRSIVANVDVLRVNRQRRSTPPRNQEEELSIPGSSCSPSFCASFKRAAPSNRGKILRTPSRSAMESLSDLESSSESKAVIEKKETEANWSERTEGNETENEKETKSAGFEVRDKTELNLEIKMDDIPYADDVETVVSTNDRSRIKEPGQTAMNPRNKLERMTSRASFVIDAVWAEQLNLKTDRSIPRSRAEGSTRREAAINRRESRFRSVRRIRKTEAAPRMSRKDKKLLKMILVIFSSFLVCYLPITVTKIFKDAIDWRELNIVGYILIYLTTCINPVVYVVMSSEYRSAYKDVLLCKSDSGTRSGARRLLS